MRIAHIAAVAVAVAVATRAVVGFDGWRLCGRVFGRSVDVVSVAFSHQYH